MSLFALTVGVCHLRKDATKKSIVEMAPTKTAVSDDDLAYYVRSKKSVHAGDDVSNSGKEFAIGFMEHYDYDKSTENRYLFLTSSKSLNYTVRAPRHNFSTSGFLLANTLVSVQLPVSLRMPIGTSDRGVLVKSTEDMTVYGMSQSLLSGDAFLALPTHVQGLEYVVPSYTRHPDSDYKSLLGVVGIHNHTRVTVEYSATASPHGKSHNVTYRIDWMQTLQLEGNDMTGSRVLSDKPVAVFGGHECANVPEFTRHCNNLVEQVPPVARLGRHFATVPFATRKQGDIFRAIASHDKTDIIVNGHLERSNLQTGEFYEFHASSTTFMSIESTQPILLMQFSIGNTADSTLSDPSMLMISPIEQYRSSYLVRTAPDDLVLFSSYLAIIVTDSEKDGLRLDNKPLSSSVLWNKIPGLTLVGANLPISDGTHTVHHVNKSTFGLSVYGFAYHDCYTYLGGIQWIAPCVVQPSNRSKGWVMI